MPDLGRLWRVLKGRVLLRKVPHTLFSWRFLLPCDGAMGLHRRVFLGAWPELPRLLYAGIVLYSMVVWFGYQGWAQLIRAYRHAAAPTAEQQGIGKFRQGRQLLVAVGRGIPPQRYYGMQLYRVDLAQWWEFVFDHELPHWHSVLQGQPATALTRRLLVDKVFFAEYLQDRGLESVPTRLTIKAGEGVPWSGLFRQRDVFCKPVSASRAEGCFALRFDAAERQYVLQTGEALTCDENRIRELIEQSLQQRDYLVQPLLRNEAELEAQLVRATGMESERISTLRIITSSGPGGISLRLANLERSAADYRRWKMYAVDLDRGEVDVEGERVVLPGWSEIIQLVREAHALCADQLTVGWDVVMTDEGPRVLEGNVNWGVQAHQLPPRLALLAGPTRAVYGLGK
ncbi:sugar-transfer associated ATP-grasp domain-containing protein [Halopseudomonas sp.]|uniref:sugar-transfer associated ATP-grasp domain-containing protein n=1 Tax=Halopseudomonas sp. TaxID=2901191 RepID=UPI0035683578